MSGDLGSRRRAGGRAPGLEAVPLAGGKWESGLERLHEANSYEKMGTVIAEKTASAGRR